MFGCDERVQEVNDEPDAFPGDDLFSRDPLDFEQYCNWNGDVRASRGMDNEGHSSVPLPEVELAQATDTAPAITQPEPEPEPEPNAQPLAGPSITVRSQAEALPLHPVLAELHWIAKTCDLHANVKKLILDSDSPSNLRSRVLNADVATARSALNSAVTLFKSGQYIAARGMALVFLLSGCVPQTQQLKGCALGQLISCEYVLGLGNLFGAPISVKWL